MVASSQCILYLGSTTPGSTSAHRAAALERLGHCVVALDPAHHLSRKSHWRAWIDFRTGYRFSQNHLRLALSRELAFLQQAPSIVWVNSGELLGPSILLWLRSLYSCSFVLYCNDDPTGPRDWNRFSSLRAALPIYDLCVYCRDINEFEWLALGAQRVLRVWMSFDEVIHCVSPFQVHPDLKLAFIGTNIPVEHRDRFLMHLMESDIPLDIHGARWQRSRFWPQLRAACNEGFAVDSGYTALLSHAALCLGLLSHRNRDLHTSRSFEAPAASTVLLAERTSEHQLLYEDGLEALFWQTPKDCAGIASHMIENITDLAFVRQTGHYRVAELGVGNEDICRQVLAALEAVSA
jgi:spore maturation protein CgeB